MVAFLWRSLKYAGTVITAPSIFSPVLFSASDISFFRRMADRSQASYVLPNASKT